jgi:hypothetical protein
MTKPVQQMRSGFSRASAFAALACLVVMIGGAHADESTQEAQAGYFSYGKQGVQFDDGTGNNFLWFGARLQTRWASTKVTQDELPGAPISESSDMAVNRGRLKLGGHLVRPAFTVYTEYDIVDSRLLDLRATYRFNDWLSIRVGQWKSEFNRERIDSSGKQQFVERSVVTPWFTIDRQQAIMASGRLGKGGRGDTSYWFGWLSGAGRGGDTPDADGLWLARAQWNLTGQVLDFSQSALKRPEQGVGSVAIAAVTGRSGFTAFSSKGGGQLPGLADGEPDQYRLQQVMIEIAYHRGVFSWQQELHWKSVDDRLSGETRRLVGGYAQAGMFLAEVFDSFPEPLDVSRIVRRQAPDTDTSNRVRLQWDWSF